MQWLKNNPQKLLFLVFLCWEHFFFNTRFKNFHLISCSDEPTRVLPALRWSTVLCQKRQKLYRGRKTCSDLSAALSCCREEILAHDRFSLWLLWVQRFVQTSPFVWHLNQLWALSPCKIFCPNLGPCGSLGISLTCPVCGESGALAGGQTDAIKSKCQIPWGTACPGKGSRLGWVLLSLRAGFWLSEFSRHPGDIHRVCGGLTQANLTSSM